MKDAVFSGHRSSLLIVPVNFVTRYKVYSVSCLFVSSKYFVVSDSETRKAQHRKMPKFIDDDPRFLPQIHS
jgi:hypothetical protein